MKEVKDIMVKGQKRHTPPPGYMSSGEAVQKLGKMLYRHVEEGRIQKITPPGRKVGYYNRDDVEKVLTEETLFSSPYLPGGWKKNPTCTFERASIEDMPAIFEISRVTFDVPITPEIVEMRQGWLRKNPETYHIVRNQAGAIVAYASLAPVPAQVIARFVRDEIDAADITPDDINLFEPGKPLHIYIMAVAVDPQYAPAEKHEYGARLVSGLFSFLLSLAGRGIVIETITARTYKPDGLRLLRKLGIPQLHSPVPGKALFAVRVADSGFPLFERYSEILAACALPRQERAAPVVVSRPAPPESTLAGFSVGNLPAGYVALSEFYHGLARSTAKRNAELTEGDWRDATGHVVNKVLSPEQQRLYYLWAYNRPGFVACERCPHEIEGG